MQTGATVIAVAGYATCSSLLLICNKLAVAYLPAPSFVLLSQVVCSWVAVKAFGLCGLITVDALEWRKLVSFTPVAVAFLASIFANIKTLQYANVETFIVFRAATPVIISIADWIFMGRQLPSLRSWLAIMALVGGAFFYVATDAQFVVAGYKWVCIWFVIFCFDQLYIKFVVDTVKVDSNWGRVFYTNLVASILLTALTLATERDIFLNGAAEQFTPAAIAALSVSCVLGTAMSYFAFLCRAAVSATSFTVIGNVCKVLTVLINILIWDKHASPLGLTCLLCCLAAAATYQQAPLREQESDEEATNQMLPLVHDTSADARDSTPAKPIISA